MDYKWIILNNLSDIKHLMLFDKDCFMECDLLSEQEYIRWFIHGLRIFILVDKDTGEWISSYQIVQDFEEGNYFAGFAVHPKYRKRGYAQITLNHIIHHFNIDKDLVCKTRRNNFPMIMLLKKNGFKNRLVDLSTRDKWTWWTRELKK